MYHKKTFDKISAEKRERILKTAVEEFSSLGYNAASINVIARKAGISIGSMYSYFGSKEDLFMTSLDMAYEVLQKALDEVQNTKGGLYEKLKRMIEISQEFATKYKSLNQMYIDLSTEALSHLSKRTSRKTEGITSAFYEQLIDEARKEGLIDTRLSNGMTAFCLDSLVMMTQFAYASEFYRERLKIFTGLDAESSPEILADGILQFMKFGLGYTKNT